MLLEWVRQVAEYDDNDNEQWVQVGQGLVVPDCCEAVQKSLTVVLRYDWEDLTDSPAYEKDDPLPENMDWRDRLKAVLSADRKPIEGKTRFDMAKPKWASGRAVDSSLGHQAAGFAFDKKAQITFCPHCGTQLPEIEKRPDIPGPTHVPVYDGDYCGTCDQRSRCCTCYYPEVAWRPVTEKD